MKNSIDDKTGQESENVYFLSEDGIKLYFETAVGKFNSENKTNYNTDIGTLDSTFTSFFGNKETKDYHVVLKNKDDEGKKELWHKRIIHFCSALKYVFEKIGNDNPFVLGIFGSESPGSDIDVGVSYKKDGPIDDNTKKISEVIKHFEDYFVYGGKGKGKGEGNEIHYTSLDLDIEMYGDYLKRKGEPYLKCTKEAFDNSLPYVVAGMLKNKVQSYIDTGEGTCDIRRVIRALIGDKTDNFHGNDTIAELCKTIDNNDNDETIENLKKNFVNIAKKELDLSTITLPTMNNVARNQISNEIKKIKGHITHYKDTGGKELLEYLTKDYNEGREQYYDLLDKVHELYNNENNDQLVEAISKALVYRAESYISPFTVYHVVYELQAGVPVRNMTSHAYEISILEQLGYFMRFSNSKSKGYMAQTQSTQAKSNKEVEIDHKQDKKNAKYLSRLLSAICKKKNIEKTEKTDCDKWRGIKTMTDLNSKATYRKGGRKTRRRRNRRTRRKKRRNSRRRRRR